jgi:hypothetical protein
VLLLELTEPVVVVVTVAAELLELLELTEPEVLEELEVPVVLPVVELAPVPLAPVVEVPVVLVVLWPELPCPLAPNIMLMFIANSLGRRTPSTAPGTSIGFFASARTNSRLPS